MKSKPSPLWLAAPALVCMVVSTAAAQTGEGPARTPSTADPRLDRLIHRTWTVPDGLPQNSVKAIAQTPDGFIWLATFGGLSRFDGVSFRVYNTANTPRMASNRLTALHAAADGTLWIGSEFGTVMAWQDSTLEVLEGVTAGSVEALFVDRDGVLWIGHGNGLSRYIDGEMESVDVGEDNAVRRIVPRDDRSLLMATNRGRWVVEGTRARPLVPEDTRSILAMAVLPDGTPVFSRVGGVYRSTSEPDRAWRAVNGVLTLAASPDGTVWMGTESGFLVRAAEPRVDSLRLGTRLVASMLVDREGIVWVGTLGDGLHQFVSGPIESRTDSTYVAALKNVVDGPDGIVVNLECRLYRVNHDLAPYDPLALANGCYHHTAAANDGGMLVSTDEQTEPGGLGRRAWLWHWNGKAARRLTELPALATSLYQDRDGRTWIGTNAGLWLFSEAGLASVALPAPAPFINGVRPSDGGGVWVMSQAGLARLADREVVSWYTSQSGLPLSHVRDVYEAGGGAVWVATYGGGLAALTDGGTTIIDARRGLCDDFLSRILPDNDGWLWFNSNRGLFRLRQSDVEAVVNGDADRLPCALFGRADGMAGVEGSRGGGRTRDGRIWMPSIDGFSIIQASTAVNPVAPTVFVDAITLSDGTVLDPVAVTLGPDQRDIEIRFGALSFRHPSHVRFAYRLRGYEPQWTLGSGRRSAFYTQLPPGAYAFEVRAFNESGVVSANRAEASIVVTPLWFERRSVWLVSAVLVLLLTGGFIRTRMVRIRRQADVLRREVERRRITEAELRTSRERARQLAEGVNKAREEERRAVAREMHDELGQSLTVVKFHLKAMRSALDRGDVAKVTEVVDHADDTIDRTTHTVGRLIDGLRPPILDDLGLRAAITWCASEFGQGSDVAWTVDLAEDIDEVSGDWATTVFRIVQECLTNVARHAQAENVHVGVAVASDMISIVVEDDGIGLSKTALETAGRFGLLGIRERAEISGGTASFTTTPTGGTRVTVQMPFRRES